MVESLLKRTTPESVGVNPSDLIQLFQYLKNPTLDVHSFMVVRHGYVIAESWWKPYTSEKRHALFSASKTFTGLAVGFAIQDGLLSLEDRVVSFFPERLPAKTCEYMEMIKVRDLLTMTTGFAQDPHDFPWPRPDDVNGIGPHCCHKGIALPKIDWIRNFFDHYVAYKPGTEFVYCTHASYMLSCIVQKVTGMTTSAYLNKKMFEPMGIGDPFWEISPDGCTVGGWGLMLTTEQLAAVGQMLLDQGTFAGQRLLSREWVKDATSVHITLDHLHDPHVAGYGYQIWIDDREKAFSFRGAFGQMCLVVPGKDMVLAWTGGTNSEDRADMLVKIWDLFIHRVDCGSSQNVLLNAQEAVSANKILAEMLTSMNIPAAAGKPSWQEERAVKYSEKRYRFGDNRINFTDISMKFASNPEEHDELTLGLNGKLFTVPVGYNQWLHGYTCVPDEDTDTDISVIFHSISCSGAWKDEGYCLVMCFDETSYINTANIIFRDGCLIFRHTRNLSFYPAVNTVLTGVEV